MKYCFQSIYIFNFRDDILILLMCEILLLDKNYLILIIWKLNLINIYSVALLLRYEKYSILNLRSDFENKSDNHR